MLQKRRRVVLWIVVCAMICAGIAIIVNHPYVFKKTVPVQFDWERSSGFISISVPESPYGSLYGHLIAAQAKPYIAAALKQRGWTSARGQLSVRIVCLVYVSGFDPYDTWGGKLIDPQVTPLMHAAEEGDIASIRTLISANARVDIRDQSGQTALMHASKKGQVGAARILLASDADPNARDWNGRTPFMWAAWNCDEELGVDLVAAGADINTKDNYGESAVGYSRCPKTVQNMIEKGLMLRKQARHE